jgi:outer membrane protein assembly factor BamA
MRGFSLRKQLLFELTLFLLITAAWAAAQSRTTATPNSTRLIEIKVVGSQRFQPDELAAATGLKPGDKGDESALKQAAERLAESGMFGNVTYSYISEPKGTRVKYEVNDTDKLVPIHVDNFVWLTPAELVAELGKREPLFRGEVPNAGEMYNKLADDMKSLLGDLHVTATVRVLPEVPQRGGDVTGFLYTVEGVNLPIRSLEFPGIAPEMNSALQKIAASSLISSNYSRSRVRTIAVLDFLPQYRMRGFLKAAFDEPLAALQDRATGSVAVRLPVNEGLQYKLSNVQWSGNRAFSNDELAKAIKGKVGTPLNQVQLEEDMGGISKVYGTRGYMEAHLEPKFSFDDAGPSVAAEIQVREGDQYHQGDVQFTGLTESAAAALRKIWKLHPGDVYDTSYPNLFLKDASRQFDFSQMQVAVALQTHRESKTVDVVVRFTRKTP